MIGNQFQHVIELTRVNFDVLKVKKSIPDSRPILTIESKVELDLKIDRVSRILDFDVLVAVSDEHYIVWLLVNAIRIYMVLYIFKNFKQLKISIFFYIYNM